MDPTVARGIVPFYCRYVRIAPDGLRVALFISRSYTRLLRPKLAQIMPTTPPGNCPLRAAFDHLQKQIDRCCEQEKHVASEVLANDQLFARFKKISCGSATGCGNGSEDEICPRLQAACG